MADALTRPGGPKLAAPQVGIPVGRSIVGGGGARSYAVNGRIMLITLLLIFAAVILALFLHLYYRWRLLSRSSGRRRRSSHWRRSRLVFAGEAMSLPAPATAVARRGLDPAVLKSLPVVVFSAAAAAGGNEEEVGSECAVCLSEFEEEEKVRSLPQCGHRFHLECIDMWFHSHTTCPLCRSAVEAAPLPAKAAEPVTLPEPGPPPPQAALPEVLCPECLRGEGAADASSSELRIEVPNREELEALDLRLKSPGSRMLLLRILSWDSRLTRSGGSAVEPDLERAEGSERPPSAPPQIPSPLPPSSPLPS